MDFDNSHFHKNCIICGLSLINVPMLTLENNIALSEFFKIYCNILN